MAKYKILSGEKLETKVEKTDFTAEFTMQEVKTHYEQLIKAKTELESKISYEKARIQNIEENHPKVKKLIEEIKQAAYLYVVSKMQLSQAEERYKHVVNVLKEYNLELEEIKVQTGLSIEDEKVVESEKVNEEKK
jgi:hypothetical protein